MHFSLSTLQLAAVTEFVMALNRLEEVDQWPGFTDFATRLPDDQ